MNSRLAKPHRKAALKLVATQAILVLIISLTILFGWGAAAAVSALIGGATAVIPSFIFALYAFRYVGAGKAKLVTSSFYRGQALKLLTTFVLFVIAFKFLDVIVAPMMVTFIFTLITHWLTPIYFNQR